MEQFKFRHIETGIQIILDAVDYEDAVNKLHNLVKSPNHKDFEQVY